MNAQDNGNDSKLLKDLREFLINSKTGLVGKNFLLGWLGTWEFNNMNQQTLPHTPAEPNK
jgi:hypothetical protein